MTWRELVVGPYKDGHAHFWQIGRSIAFPSLAVLVLWLWGRGDQVSDQIYWGVAIAIVAVFAHLWNLLRHLLDNKPELTAWQKRCVGIAFIVLCLVVFAFGKYVNPVSASKKMGDPLDEYVPGEQFTYRARQLANVSPRAFPDSVRRLWDMLPPCLQIYPRTNQQMNETTAIMEMQRAMRKKLGHDVSSMDARKEILSLVKNGMLKVQFRESVPDDAIHFRLLAPDSAETVFELHKFDGSYLNANPKYIRLYWSDEVCAWNQ